ncbi:MAG: SDR family oxidoreductase [Bacteroidetes bacterium]|nr:SDR family oxidoreductase [Bacteroidota bacterium]
MQSFSQKRVLITGGASGIGKIMGRMVLERGASLIIWDISQPAMDRCASEFASLGPVHTYCVDVSDFDAVQLAATRVLTEVGTVDVLINNAGIVAGNRYFHEQSHDDIRKTMGVNSLAPMVVSRAFLPAMIAQNSGHLCTISSSASFISNPRMAVYAASKWAATGWSDSMRLEFRRQGLNIGVTTVTPFYIDTGMFDGVRSWIPLLDPEKVCRKVIRGIERNKAWVSMPWNMHLVRLAQGLLPVRFFDWFIGDVCGIYRTMDGFQGRKKDASPSGQPLPKDHGNKGSADSQVLPNKLSAGSKPIQRIPSEQLPDNAALIEGQTNPSQCPNRLTDGLDSTVESTHEATKGTYQGEPNHTGNETPSTTRT